MKSIVLAISFCLLSVSGLAATYYTNPPVVYPQYYYNQYNYINPYNPYPYQPDNGPMRGPNSIEGHKSHPYEGPGQGY